MLERRKQLLAVTALSFLVISCGRGEPTAPTPEPQPTTGSLEVIVQTSGGDPDNDGYGLHVDTTLHVLQPSSAGGLGVGTDPIDLVIPLLAPGTHTVTLDRIADNCLLDGANPRSLDVTAGQKTVATFTIGCLATGIEVSAHTTGFDHQPSYALLVDGRFAGAVGSNDSTAVTRLGPGNHLLTVNVRGENCDVADGRQVTAMVVNRTLVPVSFEVSCAHAVRTEKIAYVVDTLVDGINGSWIVLVNPDGSGAMPVVNGDHPTWSPDGTNLAYTNAACVPYAEYYALPCTGGIGVLDPEQWSNRMMPNGTVGVDPAWGPLGQTIAFTRCCASEYVGHVYLASIDGSAHDSTFVIASVPLSGPAWSPDGQQIVVTCSTPNVLGTNLCLARMGSAGFTRLALGAGDQSSPAWSPDGKRIAFTLARADLASPQVAVVNVSTLEVSILTTGHDAAWSPDGTKLVVANVDGLYVINADGTDKTRITVGGQHEPAWRP